jgi:hypothetical protein
VTNHPGAAECWLCHRRDWREYFGPQHKQPLALAPRPPLSSITGWMVLTALIAITLGVFQAAPGLGIMLMISVLPALLITEIRATRRLRRGLSMSGAERVFSIVWLAILLPFLLVASIVIALFCYCALFAR